ncbi:MAG: 4Fe-4S dicluster domain-containing protein [Coriobacteriia bacterium]|nr:4Fe-4S dicluster domain-containing protein [Coriobacteriia bacterium]
MSSFYIEERDFGTFVNTLAQNTRVVGPVAKRQKFVFGEIGSVEELRLDYDITILPPKKVFFPPKQVIARFDADSVEGTIAPVDTVLLGVHPYDVRGIDMTDFLFRERNEDWDYLAQREATTIVASNVQKVAPRAFWASMIDTNEPKGHDAYLTKLDGGYVFETRTPKGEALLARGAFRDATGPEVAAAQSVNADALGQCQEQLPYTSAEIAKTIRESFSNEELWDELSKDCFSCGSCNTVCPTCYCFDMRDVWNLDQKSGTRTRYWDACLTKEFAAISMPGGGHENFREHHQTRFRHRFMRKGAYLNEKLGSPACTGCGRCSMACTVDIADPVRVITTIMEWS